MDMQAASLSTDSSMDMQGVSLSTTSSMDVQGASPFTSVNFQGVSQTIACSVEVLNVCIPFFPL
jgi:hypothetical protein